MGTIRVWLADVLIRLSRGLDPKRPETRALSNGRVQIHFDGVPLANISPGRVADSFAYHGDGEVWMDRP